jgi:hypothetical protein
MATRETGSTTVKRSVTLRNAVEADIRKLAGQAQAVDEWLSGYELRNAPLTAADEAWARERLAAARTGARP